MDGEIIEISDRLREPRACRWSSVKENTNRKLSKAIDIEKNFNFRFYTFTPPGIAELQLYADIGGT